MGAFTKTTFIPQLNDPSGYSFRGVAACTHGRTCVPEKMSKKGDFMHAHVYTYITA